MAMIGRLIPFQAANPNMFLKQIGEVTMKKALSLIMVFMVAAAFSATGYSAEKYVSAAGGIAWFDDADATDVDEYSHDGYDGYTVGFDSGLAILAAVGCDYGDYRLEAEFGYQSADHTFAEYLYDDGEEVKEPSSWDAEGDMSVLSLMLNAYYDIDLNGVEISPYAGIGVAQVSFDNFKLDFRQEDEYYEGWSTSEYTTAYQIGAVVGIPVADNIMLDARYRYFMTTEFTFEPPVQWDEVNTDRASHSALLGLRVGL